MPGFTSACSVPMRSVPRRLAGPALGYGPLQAAINAQLRLKRTPALTFTYDDSIERADRITRMLDEDPEEEQ